MLRLRKALPDSKMESNHDHLEKKTRAADLGIKKRGKDALKRKEDKRQMIKILKIN